MRSARLLARFCLAVILVIAAVTLIMTKGHPSGASFCRAEHSVPDGTFVSMTARVTGKVQSRDGQVLILKTKQLIHKERSYGKFQCYLYDTHDYDVAAGDTVIVGGIVTYYEKARNPGGFDRHFYYGVRGVNGRIKETEFRKIRTARLSVREMLYRFGTAADSRIRSAMGEEYGGLLSSMLLGRRMLLDQEVREMYQKNGIAHLIAISGLHLSLLSESIRRLLLRAGCRRSVSAGCTAVILLLYIGVAGAQIALIRAFLMYLIRTGAACCGRAYDSTTSLSASALAILLVRPFLIWDTSFQLSYGALAGVCCAMTCMGLREHRKPQFRSRKAAVRICGSLFMSGSVCLMTFPLICMNYYEFAPYSLILNLFVIPLMSLVLTGGAVGTVLCFVPAIGSRIAGPAFWPSFGGLYINRFLCRTASVLPLHRVVTGRPPLLIVLIYYAILAASYAALIRHLAEERFHEADRSALRRAGGLCSARAVRAAFSLTAAAFIGLCVYCPAAERLDHRTRITMLDVGQGDCLYVADGGGHHYLIDGGSSSKENTGRYVTEPFLLSQGIAKVDAVFISHGDLDHTSAISEMIGRQDMGVRIGRIITAEKYYRDDQLDGLIETAQRFRVPCGEIRDKDAFRCGPCIITCLGPPPGSGNAGTHLPEAGNEASVILELKRERFTMLFTGDTEGEGETALTDRLRGRGGVTVLKTAHHGSGGSTGEDFLSAAKPRIALISAGRDNAYGHPAPETLDRLRVAGCSAYCTKDCGALTVRTDGKGMNLYSCVDSREII